MIDIKALRELEAKATPGPWKIEDPISEEWWLVEAGKLSYEWEPLATVMQGDEDGIPQETAQANVNFLCAARNALPALLDELENWRNGLPIRLERGLRETATTRAEAAEAKLAKVRRLAEWEGSYVGEDAVRDRVEIGLKLLAILDAEPPTATVQPQATAEEEQGEANV